MGIKGVTPDPFAEDEAFFNQIRIHRHLISSAWGRRLLTLYFVMVFIFFTYVLISYYYYEKAAVSLIPVLCLQFLYAFYTVFESAPEGALICIRSGIDYKIISMSLLTSIESKLEYLVCAFAIHLIIRIELSNPFHNLLLIGLT